MSVEDRNCSCAGNNDCPNDCENNNMEKENVIMNNCMNPCNGTREEMMEQIKCYNFSVIELALYLDTHPDDEKALCLHNKYAKELKMLEDKYQKVYGPLSIKYPCNKWRWLEGPWPWERGNV